MTLDQFVAELGLVHEQFEWTLSTDDGYKPERRSKPRLLIRAYSDSRKMAAVFDPLGAVCYASTNRLYGPRNWMDSGKSLGMALPDSAMLFAASSDQTWAGPEGQRKPVPYLIALRERMIEVVGLGAAKLEG